MKNILAILFVGIFALPAMAYAPPLAPVINVHDTQMIKEQQFRREELNDYNDVQEEKARFEKRNKTSQPVVRNYTINKKPELINKNGNLKIKYEN